MSTAVLSNQTIEFENVLSLRRKMKQEEIPHVMYEIGKLVDDKGAKKNGPLITATYSVEQNENLINVDMEILLPIDKRVDFPEPYVIKDKFKLINAVCARHTGNPQLLQNTYIELTNYIKSNDLQQITPAYNVTLNEFNNGQSSENVVIDVYIGVNPSTL